jgi:ethanolamine permease
MGRDRYLPTWFGAVHPRYRTPFRSILFLIPIAIVFAIWVPLAQVITFSILAGLLNYTFMPLNMFSFRNKWPLGSIRRGFEHPFHPLPSIVLLALCIATFFAIYLGYGNQLLAMMLFYIVAGMVRVLPLQVCPPGRSVHHALAKAARLLIQCRPCMGMVGE